MNVLLRLHGAENRSPITYEPNSGFVDQKVAGYTDHFKLGNIKTIVVRSVEDGSTVELTCDSTDPCINHIGPRLNSVYLSSVSYFFSSKNAANEFAQLADEIIRKDFKEKPYLVLTIDFSEAPPSGGMQRTDENNKEVEKVLDNKTKVEKSIKKKDHLSMDAYEDNSDKEYQKTLSKFGKELTKIYQLAEQQQLDKIKGGKVEGAFAARIKLPKAKRNYINEFKGANCFMAEFGTKKYYEDLEELYLEIKDEIEEALPTDYEAVDMAYEKIYENSDDEVFHTEFYSTESMSKPSIVIQIVPDGKKNTLFMRVGKR